MRVISYSKNWQRRYINTLIISIIKTNFGNEKGEPKIGMQWYIVRI